MTDQAESGASTVDKLPQIVREMGNTEDGIRHCLGHEYNAWLISEVNQLRDALEAAQREWHHWQRAYMNLAPRFEQSRADLERVTAELAEAKEQIAEYEAAEVGQLRSLIESHFDAARGEWSCVAERDAMREVATFLFDRLDDIDTLYDACKGDEHIFYVQAARVHARRFEVATTDGYTVTFKIDAARGEWSCVAERDALREVVKLAGRASSARGAYNHHVANCGGGDCETHYALRSMQLDAECELDMALLDATRKAADE